MHDDVFISNQEQNMRIRFNHLGLNPTFSCGVPFAHLFLASMLLDTMLFLGWA